MIVICGFGVMGETVAKFLSMLVVSDNLTSSVPGYVAFDLDPEKVIRRNGADFRVMYGDGSQPLVLRTAGVDFPRAVVITFDNDKLCSKSVQRIRQPSKDMSTSFNSVLASCYLTRKRHQLDSHLLCWRV